MEIPNDFKELLGLFNAHRVEYLLVGGYALAHHGAPRYTGDLDLLIHATAENAQRILTALGQFGFGSLKLTVEDFCAPDQVIQLGLPPVRVDLLTSISGVTWEEALRGAEPDRLEDQAVTVIGRAAFIANKRASGRASDLADLEALGES